MLGWAGFWGADGWISGGLVDFEFSVRWLCLLFSVVLILLFTDWLVGGFLRSCGGFFCVRYGGAREHAWGHGLRQAGKGTLQGAIRL